LRYFVNHRLVEAQNGYIVELYLDQQLNEFSLEFLGLLKKGDIPQKADNLERAVEAYIKEKLPGLTVKAVNIMLGSLLLASIPISHLYASEKNAEKPGSVQSEKGGIGGVQESEEQELETPTPDIDASNEQASGKTDAELPSKSSAVTPTPGQPAISPNIISNPGAILVLVNKHNNLPSGYVPQNLVVPNVSFSFKEYDEKKQMRKEAASALEEMFRAAKADGINLYAVSGYRSYARQEAIFASNGRKYGLEKANQFSAKPGQSEHQTGLAMDITCTSVSYGLTQRFGSTKEGIWVKENANKFGFILRYQQGKESITGYQYEPWHLRYVGKEAAKEITERNVTLEEYLGAK
jgi:LAS superfamily LD-carboxypeptidase LdcB